MERRVMGNCHARCEPGESGENCKASSDRYLSVLKITNDGRKLALDQRLINDMLPDSETSKSATCVGKSFEIWEQTKEKKSAQIIFCDREAIRCYTNYKWGYAL